MMDFLIRDGYPKLRILLCIGGISMSDQQNVLSEGIHIIVATPGRLMDMLEKKKFNLDLCKYVIQIALYLLCFKLKILFILDTCVWTKLIG
jgi:hypothetical protein